MAQNKSRRLLWAVCLAALAAFAAAMAWLHYQQLCSPGGGSDPYTSDLGMHLAFAQRGMIYSTVSLLIGPAYALAGRVGIAVLLAACMLCSCSAPVYPRSTDEPQLQFYYCTGEGADTGIGALAARPVSVPDERPDAVLQQYLTAPAGEGFSLPDGLSSSCAFDSCEDGTLTLLLDETAPEGLPASLAAACLTLTMTQLDGVDRVRLVRTQRQTEVTYTAEQFLLYDTSADQPEYVVQLYYPDKDGLLAARDAVVRTADMEQLPLLALQALVSREVPVNLTRAIPYRTQVLDLSVTNGSASVVLSDDFMSCDVSAQQAANAVRAIAATLCALDSITAVQLSVIGETGLTYYDISQPITPQADWYAE